MQEAQREKPYNNLKWQQESVLKTPKKQRHKMEARGPVISVPSRDEDKMVLPPQAMIIQYIFSKVHV